MTEFGEARFRGPDKGMLRGNGHWAVDHSGHPAGHPGYFGLETGASFADPTQEAF
jgi:hypothetical protein